MAVVVLPIFFDTVNKRLVMSANSPDQFLLPPLHQEDTYSIVFTALRPTGFSFSTFYERMILTGLSLQISVGAAGVINANANAWTPSADNLSLTGALSLNTAGITALADGATQIFEIKLSDGTATHRGQQIVSIKKSVALAGGLIPPPGDTALGALEAKRLYAKKVGDPGEGWVLTSLAGKQLLLYHDDTFGFQAVNLN